jgi:hypothetical protein
MIKKYLSKKTIINILVFLIILSINTPVILASIEKESNEIYIKNQNNISQFDYWAVSIDTFNSQDYIYNALIKTNNWDKNNIKVLCQKNATKTQILNVLDWLRANVDSNDIVFFHVNSHGSINNGIHGIVTWDDQIITSDDLKNYFDVMDVEGMCLIFSCCFSGGFSDLTGDNRVIIMSSLKNGAGYHGNFNGEVVDFSKFIADAIINRIDYNLDNICSAEEIFSFAKDSFIPWSFFGLLFIRLQIQSFLVSGRFILAFPQINDTYGGELPIVEI